MPPLLCRGYASTSGLNKKRRHEARDECDGQGDSVGCGGDLARAESHWRALAVGVAAIAILPGGGSHKYMK